MIAAKAMVRDLLIWTVGHHRLHPLFEYTDNRNAKESIVYLENNGNF
jgi:hypothetical protein